MVLRVAVFVTFSPFPEVMMPVLTHLSWRILGSESSGMMARLYR